MPATLHPNIKEDVKHYRLQGLTYTQIANILTEKYGFDVLVNTVKCICNRNKFKKGTLHIKYLR